MRSQHHSIVQKYCYRRIITSPPVDEGLVERETHLLSADRDLVERETHLLSADRDLVKTETHLLSADRDLVKMGWGVRPDERRQPGSDSLLAFRSMATTLPVPLVAARGA